MCRTIRASTARSDETPYFNPRPKIAEGRRNAVTEESSGADFRDAREQPVVTRNEYSNVVVWCAPRQVLGENPNRARKLRNSRRVMRKVSTVNSDGAAVEHRALDVVSNKAADRIIEQNGMERIRPAEGWHSTVAEPVQKTLQSALRYA
jgi:hypothetical protein